MDTKEERLAVRRWLLKFHPEAIYEMVEHEEGDIPYQETKQTNLVKAGDRVSPKGCDTANHT